MRTHTICPASTTIRQDLSGKWDSIEETNVLENTRNNGLDAEIQPTLFSLKQSTCANIPASGSHIDYKNDFYCTNNKPLHQPVIHSGTTVGVPTSGVLSGIASPGEAHSVLPQMDIQEAADIPVVLQQGTKKYGGHPHNAFKPKPSFTFQPSRHPT